MANAKSITTITFSEYSQGTVNPVYTFTDFLNGRDFSVAAEGVIVPDSCNPTTPGIAGDTGYTGPVRFRFSEAVSSVSFDAGCFGTEGSTRVTLFGLNNFKITKVFNLTDTNIYENFSFDFGENVITRVLIRTVGTEPAGFAVDNLNVGVRPEHTTIANSGDKAIDNLIWGTKWAENTITWSFLKAGSEQPGYGTDPETFDSSKVRSETSTPFKIGQKKMTYKALGMWDDVAAIDFDRVDDTGSAPGMIRFARADISAPADAWYPDHDAHAGDVRINTNRPTGESKPGSYDFYVFIHEVGHALGLKHPHDPDGSGVKLPAGQDSHEFSIMSYRSFAGQSLDNVTNGPRSYPQTLMMNDIAAIQYLYGANFNHRSGDTRYVFSPTEKKIFETIWDGGGTDTYDASAYSNAVSIDLRPGMWSEFKSSQLAYLGLDGATKMFARGSLFNAKQYNDDARSLIENAIGGDGGDFLRGNDADNTLKGGKGADELIGQLGSDKLWGESGKDILHGGRGIDWLYGGKSDDYLAGGSGADHLYGGTGKDRLFGDSGADVLRGGRGQDQLEGDAGADLFVFDTIADSRASSIRRDTIADFTQGEDRIIISGIDADILTAGRQAWNFIGTTAFSDTAGELRFFSTASRTVIQGDVNGDSVSDFEIELSIPTPLVVGDFLL